MLASLREKKIIISLFVVMLDGVITYLIPSYFNKLSLFYPMLTVSLIAFLFDGNLKKYYKLCFFLGIVYDLLYSNIFLFNGFLFLLLSKIDSKVMKYVKNSFLFFVILVLFNIIIYDTICFLLILITNYQVVNISDLIYKIEHSILLNILSVFVYFFLFKKTAQYA